MSTLPRPARRLTPELVATLLIVAAYVAWILSMPLLPTEDGPVHLYYAQILSRLLTHSDPATAHFFHIKHLLPPYSLYYYALVLLSRFAPLLLADRLIVCVDFVLFISGFRYLARAIGPHADTATLLATPLLLNWALGMGFVNFDLAIGLSLWAIGLWLRSMGQRGTLRRAVFIVLAFATMLTHPVPLLLLLGFTTLALAIRLFQHRRSSSSSALPAYFGADLATLCLSGLTLVYVKLFTEAHPLTQVDTSAASPVAKLLHNIVRYASEFGVSFLNGHAVSIRLYRIGLALLLLFALITALRQWSHNRAARIWSIGDTFLACSLLLLVAMPFLPPSVNGSTHFADRLLIFVWIGALCAASGWQSLPKAEPGRPANAAALTILLVLALNGTLLYAANAYIRPIADGIAVLQALPVTHRGQLGLILEDPRPPAGSSYANPTWDPYMWAPVNLFRHEDAILANPPWLNLGIIPIGAQPALPASWIPQRLDDMPVFLSTQLQTSPSDRARILSSVSFVIVTQALRPRTLTLEPITAGDLALDRLWPCRTGASPWYRLCTATQPPPPASSPRASSIAKAALAPRAPVLTHP